METGTASFQVEGSAKIKRDDLAKARDEAIQNALEKAIVDAALTLPEMSANQEDFKLVKNIIVREPHKYVLYYTINEENRQAEDFQIRASVVVGVLALKNDLNKMGFLSRNITGQNELKILLTVQGVAKYTDYLKIRDFLLSRTKLIRYMYPARFTWQEAQFELEVLADAQLLADELVKATDCSLQIRYTEQNRMEMVCTL
ncbi:MAG TPA: hypothetical protein P5294_00405 [Smithellaceae bacterium]|nr:hypothetical protein [Smithellaceae bacterium]HRS88323.1 hypothetical protein [Smithellaceae bacterium]HRV24968.1 hypothetical protein [Smithellaceae bacterium]